MKKVIDSETMKCLEMFDPKETDQIINKYSKMGKWDFVETDIDGDVILSNED